MNEYDRENVNYLMQCNAAEFREWMNAMDEATLSYTMQLIQQVKVELMLEELELSEVYEGDDLTEANAVLNRFTLKG
jgi:hypothetical protein